LKFKAQEKPNPKTHPDRLAPALVRQLKQIPQSLKDTNRDKSGRHGLNGQSETGGPVSKQFFHNHPQMRSLGQAAG
jgi:hypothetical protein